MGGMAKGRKLTPSRAERLLGVYGHLGPVAGNSAELSEDEVWAVVNGGVDPSGPTLALENHKMILQQQKASVGPRGPPPRHVAASAPVNVPDWSKIYRADSVETINESGVYEDDQEDDEVVPPHEYVAREYRRIVTHSVFEGVGRTLKGRDMSRVRDTVWGQTGFDG